MSKEKVKISAINKLREEADKLNHLATNQMMGRKVTDKDVSKVALEVTKLSDVDEKELSSLSKLNASDYRRLVDEIHYRLAIGQSPQKICDDCNVNMQAVKSIQKRNREEQINELRGKTSHEFFADYNTVSSHVQSALFEMLQNDEVTETEIKLAKGSNLDASSRRKRLASKTATNKQGDTKYVQAKVTALKTIMELQEKKIKLGRELGIITVDVLPDDPDRGLKGASDDVIIDRLESEVEKIIDMASKLGIKPDEIDKFLMDKEEKDD